MTGLFTVLYVISSTLKSGLMCTGGQCRDARIGVISNQIFLYVLRL